MYFTRFYVPSPHKNIRKTIKRIDDWFLFTLGKPRYEVRSGRTNRLPQIAQQLMTAPELYRAARRVAVTYCSAADSRGIPSYGSRHSTTQWQPGKLICRTTAVFCPQPLYVYIHGVSLCRKRERENTAVQRYRYRLFFETYSVPISIVKYHVETTHVLSNSFSPHRACKGTRRKKQRHQQSPNWMPVAAPNIKDKCGEKSHTWRFYFSNFGCNK